LSPRFEAVVTQAYTLSPSYWFLFVDESLLPSISNAIRSTIFDGRTDLDIETFKTTQHLRVEVTAYDPTALAEVEATVSSLTVDAGDEIVQALLPDEYQGFIKLSALSAPTTTIIVPTSPPHYPTQVDGGTGGTAVGVGVAVGVLLLVLVLLMLLRRQRVLARRAQTSERHSGIRIKATDTQLEVVEIRPSAATSMEHPIAPPEGALPPR